jgi:hypothetical protein
MMGVATCLRAVGVWTGWSGVLVSGESRPASPRAIGFDKRRGRPTGQSPCCKATSRSTDCARATTHSGECSAVAGRDGCQHVALWFSDSAAYTTARQEILESGLTLVHENGDAAAYARFAYFETELPGGLMLEIAEALTPKVRGMFERVARESMDCSVRTPATAKDIPRGLSACQPSSQAHHGTILAQSI